MCGCEQGTCPGGCPCGCDHYFDPEAIRARISDGSEVAAGLVRAAWGLFREVERLRATVAAQDATLQRVKALADEWDRAADAIQNPSGGHLRIEKPSDLVQAATIRLRAALASEATDTDTDEQPTKETQ